MRERIREIFKSRVAQIINEEEQRAACLKDRLKNVDIAYLLTGYGRAAREALEAILLISSPLSFDAFLADCFKNTLRSQDYVSEIKATAGSRGVHASKILFEWLPDKIPKMTVSDLIGSLEHACLYRAIASLELDKCMTALTEYEKSKSLPTLKPQSLRPTDITKTNTRGNILLTYSRDGQDIAHQLKAVLETPSGKSKKAFYVVTLSQFTDFIAENRALNLRELISMVDYVVPILTNGYIEILEKREAPENATLDEDLFPLLFRLLEDDWLNNGFRNKKVRCFRPKYVQLARPLCEPFSSAIEKDISLFSQWLKPRKKISS